MDVLVWLKRIVEQFNVAIDENEMQAATEYATFVKSPEFAEFHEWYQSRAK